MPAEHPKKIIVPKYHLTLLWPVLLRGKPPGDPNHPPLLRWSSWFSDKNNAGWSDPLAGMGPDEMPPVSGEYSYAETVYFHPFVRDFLMGDGGTKKKDRAAHLLTRDDVKGVRVRLAGLPERTYQVERVQLHLMKPSVAVLAVEVSATGVSLWELQQFQDQFRRIYPPFFDEKGIPGLCAESVVWLDKDGRNIPMNGLRPGQAMIEAFTREGGEPPVDPHWQFFFGNLLPLQTRKQLDDMKQPLCFQSVMDERIPTMSYFAFTDPSQVAEGDYDRLTFVDAASDTDDTAYTYPYHREFLARSREKYRYERFSHYGTTYLCSGYGFTVVGKYDPFFTTVVLGHFRRHYFRMGLLAHYQRAALLYFADELSNAIKKLEGKGTAEELQDEKFRKHVEDIQMKFLKFRSRSYFSEVSNQMQAQELFRFWFDHLNSKPLFDQVDATSQRLTSVLAESETRSLTRVASYGVPLSVGLAAASASFAAITLLEIKGPEAWCAMIATLAVCVVGVGLCYDSLGLFRRWCDRED